MADPQPEPAPEKPKLEWQLPSWKKIGEFVANVMRLERAVETLKEENRKLQEQVSRLQRHADDQAGQLKVLLSFVHTSLRDQVETRAEGAAIRVFERLIAFKGDDEKPKNQR
jgi:predicted RNase H-like nuclease (RuvC/YqgF family)